MLHERRTLLTIFAALSTVPIAFGYVLVLAGAADPRLTGNIAALTTCLGITGVLATPLICVESRGLSTRRRISELVFVWTIISAVAQFFWELPWLVLHRALDGVTEVDRWAWLWWLYGTADRRWIEADPFVVGMESSMVATGVLALLAFKAIRAAERRRAAAYEIVIGLTQFVLVVLYYLVEALAGNPSITSNVYEIVVKYIYMNSFWCVLPLIQIWHGFQILGIREVDSAAIV
ncbi:hypothetical protein [Mycobacterium sp. NPDC050441]|uniref:hypothetical protein n=1 Tax=Mycobacterium sp. NPDC050441 TaxID=3155403 RepID=UPI0033F9C5B9